MVKIDRYSYACVIDKSTMDIHYFRYICDIKKFLHYVKGSFYTFNERYYEVIPYRLNSGTSIVSLVGEPYMATVDTSDINCVILSSILPKEETTVYILRDKFILTGEESIIVKSGFNRDFIPDKHTIKIIDSQGVSYTNDSNNIRVILSNIVKAHREQFKYIISPYPEYIEFSKDKSNLFFAWHDNKFYLFENPNYNPYSPAIPNLFMYQEETFPDFRVTPIDTSRVTSKIINGNMIIKIDKQYFSISGKEVFKYHF
jgi:hypothetical protein